MSKTSQAEFAYLKLANNLEKQILTGLAKVGEKIPSVRTLKKEYGLSISTILKALYHLEAKGLIQTRPQSGFYVSFISRSLPLAPKTSTPSGVSTASDVEEIINTVYKGLSRKDLIYLSLNAPDPTMLPVPKLNKGLINAIRADNFCGMKYEEIQGNLKLRQQIAKWSLLWNGNLNEEDIISTSGCMNATTFALMATTEKGDTIVTESPVYFGILQLAYSLGLNVIELPTDSRTGIDPDALRKLLKNTKIKACVLVSNFSNPLGSCMPDANKMEVVKMLDAVNVPLIEIDLYADIFFREKRPKSCKSFDESGNVIWCSSVSKTLAPGYRVGWTAPGKFKDKIQKLKLYQMVTPNTLAHEVVGTFLENGRYEYHLKKLRNHLQGNSIKFVKTIVEYFPENTRVNLPTGGLSLWVELDKHLNSYEMFSKLINQGISIAPGRMFTLQNQFNNCMRLSYGVIYNEKVEEALKNIGAMAKKMVVGKG